MEPSRLSRRIGGPTVRADRPAGTREGFGCRPDPDFFAQDELLPLVYLFGLSYFPVYRLDKAADLLITRTRVRHTTCINLEIFTTGVSAHGGGEASALPSTAI